MTSMNIEILEAVSEKLEVRFGCNKNENFHFEEAFFKNEYRCYGSEKALTEIST